MFRYANELLFHRFDVDVGEVNVEEFHAADLLQLFLHTATSFESVLQAAANGFLVIFFRGVQQLQQSRNGVLDGNRIPLVQITPQLEILVDGIAEVALPHLPQPLGQIVHDEAILVREELRPHLGNLPARDIGMEAVEESRVDHCLRERGEEMARLHQSIDRLVDVADEYH